MLGVTLDTHLTFTQHCNNVAVKVLGVTLDTHLTFTQHCNNVAVKVLGVTLDTHLTFTQHCNNVAVKVLGVTLDTHLTFTQHCNNNVAVKVQQCNNVLKALAGSTWGCDKETLLTTYQTIDRSILSYCCPGWTPSLMDTNWSRPKRAKKSGLRIATGCLKMADVTELHQEAQELPVRQLNEQFAIAYHLPQHPCHQLCH